MSIELRLLDIASELAGLIARGWTNYIIYIEIFFTKGAQNFYFITQGRNIF